MAAPWKRQVTQLAGRRMRARRRVQADRASGRRPTRICQPQPERLHHGRAPVRGSLRWPLPRRRSDREAGAGKAANAIAAHGRFPRKPVSPGRSGSRNMRRATQQVSVATAIRSAYATGSSSRLAAASDAVTGRSTTGAGDGQDEACVRLVGVGSWWRQHRPVQDLRSVNAEPPAFRMLCLDGGGMRSLQAALVAGLEEILSAP